MSNDMNGFYIKNVTALSAKNGNASITFKRGLNIIRGRSDTGKTCIAKCIDYIFGAEASPFYESEEYTGVTMQIRTNSGGSIVLTREVGSKKVQVESGVPIIESGTYTTTYREKQKLPTLNTLWLKLMGIAEADTENPKVARNQNFDPARLTWRTLLRMYYLDEETIDGSDSILMRRFTDKTLFESCLLYLVTGESYAGTSAREKQDIKRAKHNAVAKYVRKKIDQAEARRGELEAMRQEVAVDNPEKRMSDAIAELQDIQQAINDALRKGGKLFRDIIQIKQKAAESDLLLSRFRTLDQQYQEDIDRLSLIVEGEKVMDGVPPESVCPFCSGKIASHSRESHKESVRAELARIFNQHRGLIIARRDVMRERGRINAELKNLESDKSTLDERVKRELRPREDEQKLTISKIQKYMQVVDELAMIDEYTAKWREDLSEMNKEYRDEKELQYHPTEYFEESFIRDMTACAETILQECEYRDFTDARFSFDKLDIEVNGQAKTAHGKGYRSFLNTVVLLMFRKYLYEHAKYDARMFIIDTPLHGFDEGVDESLPESMRTALYNYFIEHQEEGQLIVIENLDHIPHLQYEKRGATVIIFDKGLGEDGGRYGFLNNIK